MKKVSFINKIKKMFLKHQKLSRLIIYILWIYLYLIDSILINFLIYIVYYIMFSISLNSSKQINYQSDREQRAVYISYSLIILFFFAYLIFVGSPSNKLFQKIFDIVLMSMLINFDIVISFFQYVYRKLSINIKNP